MSIYHDILLDHYRNPRQKGRLTSPTNFAESINVTCGDKVAIHLDVQDGVVRGAAFEGFGCTVSQASASMLMQVITGKTVSEVNAMTKDDILGLLGIELSFNRLKCALLSLEVTQKALDI